MSILINSVQRFSFFPHSCQHLLFVFFLMISHSNQCEVVSHHSGITTEVISQTNANALTFISLITIDPEHLFMCLLVIFISSLEKCIQFTCPFFNHFFLYVELNELFIHVGY